MDSDERIFEIELERLKDFPQHPFKVLEDRQMIELMESIRKYGVLNPLIVRPVPEGFYEIISGHRRKYAAEHLGYRKVPVIIRTLKDEEAIVFLVDSNRHIMQKCTFRLQFAIIVKRFPILGNFHVG